MKGIIQNHRIVAFILFITAISLSSCSSAKMNNMLTYHNAQLEQLSIQKMEPTKKVDVLVALMIEALEQSLEFKKSKDSVKFLRAYTKQNKQSVDRIYKDIERWFMGLSTTGKLIETARLGTKPYVRQLYNIVPKVEKKIGKKLDKVFFLARFTKLLKWMI